MLISKKVLDNSSRNWFNVFMKEKNTKVKAVKKETVSKPAKTSTIRVNYAS
jgi:hypothetical protein